MEHVKEKQFYIFLINVLMVKSNFRTVFSAVEEFIALFSTEPD